jgi:regulator of sigma E protease
VILALVVSTGVFAWYGKGYVPPVIDSIVAGRPAAVAGIQSGDRVLAIDGTAVTRWEEVLTRISAAPGRSVALELLRGIDTVRVAVVPEAQETTTAEGARAVVGRIGVGVKQDVIREAVGLGEAAQEGWRTTWAMAGNIVGVLGNLLTGEVSVSQLGGPVEIARSSVAAAQNGMETLWSLIAFLSINLAVLNLLPIPLLDGGQVVLQVAEAAWRRPFPRGVKEWYARIGFALIALLFLTVTFNDLKRLVLGWFGG